MIFVTVGAQMPFDRLIGWVDEWAESTSRDDVVAQIGPSQIHPRRVRVIPFMTPPEFRDLVEEADIVIAHAGMGSIINALEAGKPIVVVPRLGALDETRNDHQVATAHQLAQEGLVLMASTPEELAHQISHIETNGFRTLIEPTAQPGLLDRLRSVACN